MKVLRAIIGTTLLTGAGVLVICARLSGTRGPGDEPTTLPSPSWFRDATAELGIDFVHDVGPPEHYFMPAIMGSGCALFDADGDGRLDVYLLQNAGPDSGATNRFFLQEPGGRFRDATEESGLGAVGYGMGVAVGDVNNDGRPDVFVTEYGGVRLFVNLGDARFSDRTREAGLDNPLWGASAAFFDYDCDGWLDLVVVNYLEYDRHIRCVDESGVTDFCGPKSAAGSLTRLYRNLGAQVAADDGPRFEDVTVASGLGRVRVPGLGVVCADFDGDRWPDLFVANDAWANCLWINQRDGTFRDEAAERGLAYPGNGVPAGNMGVALGDVDGDGLFDLVVTHLSNELHTCWRQGPRGYFTDQTAVRGLASAAWHNTGFGTALLDCDRDGWLDLVIAAGAVRRLIRAPRKETASAAFWDRFRERNQVFVNRGEGKFGHRSLDEGAFCDEAAVSRGLAYGDIDGNGALDLLVTRIGGPAKLYLHAGPAEGHWLLVRAIDPALGGRDAYGAEVKVVAGERQWTRWINPGSSYLSSNDPRAHFGLGAAERVDRIHVLWPDGTEEEFGGMAANRAILISRSQGLQGQ